MTILGLDSSTSLLAIGLVKDAQILGDIAFNVKIKPLNRLIPWIEFLLHECSISLENVNAFACVTGPGSFTGLRIGISTIKGMALALNKPVIGYCSLDILAKMDCTNSSVSCVLIHSCQDTFFYAFYQNGKRIKEPALDSLEHITCQCSKDTRIISPNVDTVTEIMKRQGTFLDIPLVYAMPKGSFVALSGMLEIQEMAQGATLLQSSLHIAPLYLRPSRAEENSLSKK